MLFGWKMLQRGPPCHPHLFRKHALARAITRWLSNLIEEMLEVHSEQYEIKPHPGMQEESWQWTRALPSCYWRFSLECLFCYCGAQRLTGTEVKRLCHLFATTNFNLTICPLENIIVVINISSAGGRSIQAPWTSVPDNWYFSKTYAGLGILHVCKQLHGNPPNS